MEGEGGIKRGKERVGSSMHYLTPSGFLRDFYSLIQMRCSSDERFPASAERIENRRRIRTVSRTLLHSSTSRIHQNPAPSPAPHPPHLTPPRRPFSAYSLYSFINIRPSICFLFSPLFHSSTYQPIETTLTNPPFHPSFASIVRSFIRPCVVPSICHPPPHRVCRRRRRR